MQEGADSRAVTQNAQGILAQALHPHDRYTAFGIVFNSLLDRLRNGFTFSSYIPH
jgi:hypothetical protein